MVQRAISSGPDQLDTTEETRSAGSGDPRSQLVMPEVWPHSDSINQTGAAREPRTVNKTAAIPWRASVWRDPRSSKAIQISPRSTRTPIEDLTTEAIHPNTTVVPAPWPFDDPESNTQGTRYTAAKDVQGNVAPVGKVSPWRQAAVTATQATVPTASTQPDEVARWQQAPGAVPVPQPLDEEPTLPTLDESAEVEQPAERSSPLSIANGSTPRRASHSAAAGGDKPVDSLPDGASKRSSTRHLNTVGRTSLQIINRHAAEHVRYGFNLAEKGAVHSARKEFVEALSIIADALKVEGDASRRRALIAGLRALEEANDFARQDKPLDAPIIFQRFLEVHKTPILAKADLEQLTPYVAMQQYFAFAEQQLAYAGGGSPAASRALYGLARIQPFLAGQEGPGNSLGGPKVIALHRAALANDPRNHEAANELGVQLARYGQLPAAAEAFKHSLSVHPVPEAWHNLARVCEEQGNLTQARFARAKHAALVAATQQGNSNAAGEPAIRWVDPEIFSPSSARQQIVQGDGNSKSPTDTVNTRPAASNPIQRIGRLFNRNRMQ